VGNASLNRNFDAPAKDTAGTSKSLSQWLTDLATAAGSFINVSFADKGKLILGTSAGTPANLDIGITGQCLSYDTTAAVGARWGFRGVERRYGTAMATMDTTATNLVSHGAISAPSTFGSTVSWQQFQFIDAVNPSAQRPVIQFTTGGVNGNTAGVISSKTDSRINSRPVLMVYGMLPTITSSRVWIGLASADLSTVGAPPTAAAANATKVMAIAYDSTLSANWLLVTGDGTNWSGTDTGMAVVASAGTRVQLTFAPALVTMVLVHGTNTTTTTKSTNIVTSSDSTNLTITASVTTLTNAARNLLVTSYSLEQN
jgi:hypothetical protein